MLRATTAAMGRAAAPQQACAAARPLGGDEGVLPRTRLWLIDLAGIAYAITLHTFAIRDPLASGSGVQGVIDILGTVIAFACVAIACWRQKRQFACSPVMLCFTAFTLFALCSSWRSYNPILSLSKAGLLLMTLGTVYLACQAGQGQRFLLAVYRGYTGMVFLGLIAGFLLPHTFPLWGADEFTGRTRLSVWATHAGVLGEDILVLLLAAPLLGKRVGPVSQSFLVLINILSGGKTSTALLLLAYLVRAFAGLRRWRSHRSLTIVAASTLSLAFIVLIVSGLGPHLNAVDHLSQSFYGKQVGQDATSLDGRTALWVASVKLLPTAVFLGYGISGSREVMLATEAWAGSSHSSYLEMALGSGLIGMAFLLAGFWYAAKAGWQTPKPEGLYALLLVGSLAILSAIGSILAFPSNLGCLLLLWVYYRLQSSAVQLSPIRQRTRAHIASRTNHARNEEVLACR